MKTKNAVWKKILKMSLASTFAVTPLVMEASAVQAAPPPHAPAYGYRNKDHKNDKDYKKDKDHKKDKNRDRDHDRNDYRTFTGRVSNVRGQQFDLRVGGTTYNVYASSRLPRGLDENDTVRVYGQRYGDNNIRNANVRIIRNTPGNSGDWNNDRNRFETLTGRVTGVESNSRFNIQSGGREYNVYLSGNAPRRLDKNDTVRVYGRRYGDNDIRNANVSIIRNTPGSYGNNNNEWDNYQTFTGTVTNVKSNSEFDVRIGDSTYNVYLSGNAPRRLDRNDIVRVYGRRFGDNDIRNANVVVVRSR